MRVINESISLQQILVVERTAVSEEIVSIYEHQIDRFVNVTTTLRDAEGAIIQSRVHEIKGPFYDMLMAASSQDGPGKPENEYREFDLWRVIELIKSETP